MGAVNHKKMNLKSLQFKYLEILITLHRKGGKLPLCFDRFGNIAIAATFLWTRKSQEKKFIGKQVIRHMDNIHLKQTMGFM